MAEGTYVVTNRIRARGTYGPDPELRGGLHFLMAPGRYVRDPRRFREVRPDAFRDRLLGALRDQAGGGRPARAVIFIHGYNTSFRAALAQLQEVGTHLVAHAGYDGLVVGFSWPSEGKLLAYLRDRDDARESVTGFVHLMHLIKAIRTPGPGCFVELSVLAHSMGNYVLREGLEYFWKHVGYPWDDIYFTQALMVAADVAHNSLEIGGSGRAITSFSHRVTVYHSVHDEVLGLSTAAKHFGSRRLGRSGPADYGTLPENVVGVDCSAVVTPEVARSPLEGGVHMSYWLSPAVLRDWVATMSGQDRAAIPNRTEIPGTHRRGYVLSALP